MSSAFRSLGARAVPLTTAVAVTFAAYTVHAHAGTKWAARADDTPYELVANQPLRVPRVNFAGVPSTITPLVWGNNEFQTLLPDIDKRVLKGPTFATHLGATPLRDLMIQEKYGAAIDARGDLWMWGAGHDPSGSVNRSLRGKKLTTIAAGPGKVFVLSKDGRLFVVSADRAFQDRGKAPRNWWKKLTTRDPLVDFVQLKAAGGFNWGESWEQIAVGRHHLLAVTNKGRTFSLPLSNAANTHRQLGTKQVFEPVPDNAVKAIAESPDLPPESDPRFATQLTEIPALSGLRIAQVAASDRSSFVRTPDGRVLGFGANDFGQIGLGQYATVATVPTPVEIQLSKAYASGTAVTCTGVTAGAQSTLFTVERVDGKTGATLVDVLSCGNGQSGTLGNGLWSSAMFAPQKVKNVSGLQEYSEKTQSITALGVYKLSIAPSPNTHAYAAIDSVQNADAKGVQAGLFGRDVMEWGGNADYQLGNGKRSSLAVPAYLESPLPRAADKVEEKPDGEAVARLSLHQNTADAYDLEGNLIKRGVRAEETIVAGYSCSVLYNKIVS
ncbi:hypothetical protein VHUM_01300 [Vanrija humicola]|uniref:Uncharacterized protein n=1 Tax=Vanrija humicola TaxID=5417 RepID=A0A7D8V2V5_VANHU|nr:hypothetical protein VHUM_01300 [Vanrija humicola]